MKRITLEDYTNAINLVKEYENAMVLGDGIPCFIVNSRGFDKPIVFTDEEMAHRHIDKLSNGETIETRLFEPQFNKF